MAWNVKDVLAERIKFVVRASSGKETITKLCQEFGISRPTGYLWLERYQAKRQFEALRENSRRPLNSPQKTCAELEDKVIALRERYGWGAKKLHYLLADDQTNVSVSTINRIFKRNGLIKPWDTFSKATKRFERETPNELWQIDFKGQFTFGRNKDCYPLTVLDDHSRYSIGITALTGTGHLDASSALIKAFQRYGTPRSMLMDHGSPWWSTHSEHGLTKFSVKLIQQGIKLIYSGRGHPQTQGKIERFHRTLNQAVKHRGMPRSLPKWQKFFDHFRQEYNQVRPHEALGMKVPASRYSPSLKPYLSKPEPWLYPTGSTVLRVNEAGTVNYKASQFFVSHALTGERIQAERLQDSLIITYRHMLIREINLRTGRSLPLINNN